jgi:transposase
VLTLLAQHNNLFAMEARMEKYIGMDIDNKKIICCVVQQGKKDIYRTIKPTVPAMKAFITEHKTQGCKIHLVFEISGQAGYIYDSLIDCADSITVANPSKMTWIYRTAKKNDRLDARKMAVLLSIAEVPSVYMPSREVRQWRQTILHRRNIVTKVTQAKNRIRALLKSVGFSHPWDKGSWWKKSNRFWMGTLVKDGQISSCGLWRMQLGNLLEQLCTLENQLNRLTEYLDRYLSQKHEADLLMSIPGIGPRTTEAVLAYTDNLNRFDNYKQYCSYFGLTPKLDESGSTRRLGHISKHGPSVVRWVLCESSWKVIRKSKALKDFYERVKNGQDCRKKIAIVAVCRKLLCIMRAMLRDNEKFNEELAGRICRDGKQIKSVA